MLDLVEKLEEKLRALDEKMVDPDIVGNQKELIRLNRERCHLEEILATGRKYKTTRIGIDEAKEIIDANEDDELVAMARQELQEYEAAIENVEKEFKLRLLPRDPNDDKAAIVEVRAGTGGDEAGLFAGDIFRMYQKFADSLHWKLEIMNSNPTGVGGFK